MRQQAQVNAATPASSRRGGPSVIRFKARLLRQAGAAKNGSSALIDIPNAVSKKLRGMTKVEGVINGHPFRAALEPQTNGGRSVRVNAAMRNGAGAGMGDTVSLAILGPEPAPRAPADLRAALAASHEATALWKDLDTDGRRIYIRWIEAAKTLETRARRVARTVDQLSEGKRRPCCVNVYEYMLCRVQE